MAKQTFTTGQVLTADNMTSLQQTAMGGGSATAKTASYTLVAADAGTTIIMNSGSATTITVNTALFAAGDTVLIVNQGAGVCTVTAGTATVDTAGSLALSQYETGQLYFLSTSAAIFAEYTQSAGGGFTFAAYTPTYTNITVGNGTLTARYGQSGKFVVVNWRLVLGSTSSIGSAPKITLPVTATNNQSVGSAYYLDAATAEFIGLSRLFDTSNIQLIAPQAGGVNTAAGLSSTFPFTWTTSDEIRITLVYEAA
jgi:hypothetical protein